MSVADQLTEVRRGLSDAEQGIVRLAQSVGDEAWTKRPPGGGWSAAECIAHLTMTTDSYLGLLAAAKAAAKPGMPLPSKYGREFGARMLEWILKPPARMRSKTIASFIPEANAPKADTVAAFTRSQRALLDWMKSVESLRLDQMIVTSPFNERLKYNAYAALRVMAAHQRRHLWQAERAVREIP